MTQLVRLTALDTAFLRAETRQVPLHVGAVAVFEGGSLLDQQGRVRIDVVRTAIARRLHLVPRLRQVVREVPLGLGRPFWVDDPHFDIAHHVRVVHLPPPGDRDGLLALAADLHEELLDRTRPLWQLWFVEGLAGGRVGMVEKIHHAMVDGVSGVDVAATILDLEPNTAVGEGPIPSAVAGPRLVDVLGATASDRLQQSLQVLRLLAAPRRVVGEAHRLVSDLVNLEEEGLLAPPSWLNRPVGVDRRLAGLTRDLSSVKQAARAHQATVNDVVLTAVAGGIRALAAARDEGTSGGRRALKVLVPVSLRPAEHDATLGNRVSALVAPLRVDIEDPVARLVATAAWTHRAKRSRAVTTTARLLDGANALPPLAVSVLSRLVVGRQPLVNLVVTNVPGVAAPLYLLDAQMVEAIPIVPLGGNLTVGVAVLSYDGNLTLGFTADEDAVPDLDVLVDAVGADLDLLAGRAAETTEEQEVVA